LITITVHGRLAAQPELKMLGNNTGVCEFRLLSSRFAKGEELTEAVTFFCFGDDAEEFASTTVKGQEISATGTQETNRYTDAQKQVKTFVKYRLTWFSRGRKPYTGERSQQGQDSGYRQSQNRPEGNRAGGDGQNYAAQPRGDSANRQPSNAAGHQAQQTEPESFRSREHEEFL
jgi:single-stranded DNA-binding protein